MDKTKKRSKISPTSAIALKKWWFCALMASESYALAHAFRCNELSKKQIANLPWDFGLVLQTYDDFGWVGNIAFVDWLNNKDKVLFRTSKAIPSVSTIGHIPRGDKGDVEKLTQELMKYLYTKRENTNFSNSLIVSIPLNMSKRSIIKQITSKIDAYKKSTKKAKDPVDVEIPLYSFRAKKLKTTAFNSSLKTLHTKIRNPDWPLWKVGAEIDLHTVATRNIREAEASREEITKQTGKRPKPQESAYESKMTMNTLVNRQIKYALLLAENAARGRFPSIDPILDKDGQPIKLKMDYDYMCATYDKAEKEYYERYPQP